jgi:hypothetical protein
MGTKANLPPEKSAMNQQAKNRYRTSPVNGRAGPNSEDEPRYYRLWQSLALDGRVCEFVSNFPHRS